MGNTNIETMLTASFFNITPETHDWLETIADQEEFNKPFSIYKRRFDSFLIPLTRERKIKLIDIPKDLTFILGYAKAKDINWLLIDMTVEDNESLPVYDWGDDLL